MSYDYSENILVQEAAGNLLHKELDWDVVFAYNKEVLGKRHAGQTNSRVWRHLTAARPLV